MLSVVMSDFTLTAVYIPVKCEPWKVTTVPAGPLVGDQELTIGLVGGTEAVAKSCSENKEITENISTCA